MKKSFYGSFPASHRMDLSPFYLGQELRDCLFKIGEAFLVRQHFRTSMLWSIPLDDLRSLPRFRKRKHGQFLAEPLYFFLSDPHSTGGPAPGVAYIFMPVPYSPMGKYRTRHLVSSTVRMEPLFKASAKRSITEDKRSMT